MLDETKMRTIYLSGPMRARGRPNYPVFYTVASRLRSEGHVVYNPAEYPATDEPIKIRETFLAYATFICTQADTIVLLPGWSAATNSVAEFSLAKAVGLEVIFWHNERQKLIPNLEELVKLCHKRKSTTRRITAAPTTLTKS